MSEYTPSPAKARNIYKDFGEGPTPASRMDEFDRMIREVQAKAWDECVSHIIRSCTYVTATADEWRHRQLLEDLDTVRDANPYKEQS